MSFPRPFFKPGPFDDLLGAADQALRTLWATPYARRPMPNPDSEAISLGDAQRSEAAALMRVNHVGEVCAQALYSAQSLATRQVGLQAHLKAAADEEADHLAWTEARIQALGGRKSWLNPLWYAGAFALAYATAKVGGERISLGFVLETERQVEAHLHRHLARLPAEDTASRAVVEAMAHDEAQHAREAQRAGAAELPEPLKRLMALSGRVMTTVAHRV
ncbi:MAG: 2-polyprenyl-3-methyl-6-methoxy-1,4-benzoquinone monooxygenase [Betaproteobacteria bacterium]|nr:2-polyprenyl-3-methyl-6-methoxy-1,4-benzoquinone monooxygenase [Betaproteobacteria bacterium]